MVANAIESGTRRKRNICGPVTRQKVVVILVIVLGVCLGSIYLTLGILREKEGHKLNLEHSAFEKASWIHRAGKAYEIVASLAQNACHRLQPPDKVAEGGGAGLEPTLLAELHLCKRTEFKNLYEYMLSLEIGLFSLQYATRVEHRYREALEADSRAFLLNNPSSLNYLGITAPPSLSRQTERPFYYPIHYAEPFEANAAILDMDVYGDPISRALIDSSISSWKPHMSPRLKLIQDPVPDTYSVYLVHPGANTSVNEAVPHAVTASVIRIPDLLRLAACGAKQTVSCSQMLYLFDATDDPTSPSFLGGLEIGTTQHEELCQQTGNHTFRQHQQKSVPEIRYGDIPRSRSFDSQISMVDRQWIVTVVSNDATPDFASKVVVGCLIFCVFFLVAVLGRRHQMYKMSRAEAKKAEHVQRQLKRERYLNEYLAHEVRNPLSCAVAAVNLAVSTAKESIYQESTRSLLLNDLDTANHSLEHINALLRSMLDMHRENTGRIRIDDAPTHILQDVLKPIATLLSMRGSTRAEILVECSPSLIVMTDCLRLKQIILNLSINATKFVEQGFIRLRADVVDGRVELYVEDSGPGVPPTKQAHLFEAFQESLDLLSQGTGMGLFICASLSKLLGAKLWFDDSYKSEIDGCPGARFVVGLQKQPVEVDVYPDCRGVGGRLTGVLEGAQNSTDCSSGAVSPPLVVPPPKEGKAKKHEDEDELPESLRVLFVDDETILRKLFIRTATKTAPTWNIEEARNGEAALHLLDRNGHNFYDVIFVDQYMPCIEQPLLGTEVVRLMREKDVASIICGISANNVKDEFLSAGADSFILKPFPCTKDSLRKELSKLFRNRRKNTPARL